MLNLARILTQLDIPWQRSLMFVRPLDTLPSAHSVPSGQLFCVPNKLILDTDETVKMKPFLVFCQRCFCTKLKVPRTVNMNITWIGIGPYNYRLCKKPSYWLLATVLKNGRENQARARISFPAFQDGRKSRDWDWLCWFERKTGSFQHVIFLIILFLREK